jgi:hypothetical protein
MHNDTPAAARMRQRHWAQEQGLAIDRRDYLDSVRLNLRRPLSPTALAAFRDGDGKELIGGDGRPPKMRSLISSSALAANAFGYWDGHASLAPLLEALGLPSESGTLAFERKLVIRHGWTPPNVDVVITTDSGRLVGIESKFTEWMTPTPEMPRSVARYIAPDDSCWSRVGLPRADRLARAIASGAETFEYLHVPQLLKHALGLALEAGKTGAPWALRYVFQGATGPVADRHAEEIARFGAAVGEEVGFGAVTYLSLMQSLTADASVDRAYLRYLDARYVRDAW